MRVRGAVVFVVNVSNCPHQPVMLNKVSTSLVFLTTLLRLLWNHYKQAVMATELSRRKHHNVFRLIRVNFMAWDFTNADVSRAQRLQPSCMVLLLVFSIRKERRPPMAQTLCTRDLFHLHRRVWNYFLTSFTPTDTENSFSAVFSTLLTLNRYRILALPYYGPVFSAPG